MVLNHKIKTLLGLVAIISMATSCSSEDIEVKPNNGIIRLSLTSEPAVLVDVETRATQTADPAYYTITLNGETTPLDITQPIIRPAGEYTITAKSKTDAYTAPYYEGSTTFTLEEAEVEDVTIALGAPKNAQINVTFDDSFTQFYENYNVTLSDGTHTTSSLTTGSAYFMPGTITYTIHGTAKSGSHVQEIPSDGTTGTLTIEAGKAYPLTIKANPIDGYVRIDIGTEDHTGSFD